MKYLIRCLLLLHFLVFLQIQAEELYIVSVSPSPIIIGGKELVKGDSFQDNARIQWSSPKQAMSVIPKKGGSPRGYSSLMFKHRNISILEYLNKPNPGSTLGQGDDLIFIEGKNNSDCDEKRIALVIGNSNYEFINRLNTPLYDAIDISDKLVELGFDVTVQTDLCTSDFVSVLRQFSGMAIGYDVALIYYSGHGIQYKGRNYIIPIDRTTIPKDILQSIDIERDIYPVLNSTECQTKLLFLNACRNAPSGEPNEEFRTNAISGIRVSFSTASGNAAYESESYRNSPYAEAFLSTITQPSPFISTTITNIGVALNAISKRMGLPPQNAQDFGDSPVTFTFVKPSSVKSSEVLMVTDIRELERLASLGDTRAFIKVAQYYLKHADMYGRSAYEYAHSYALKAWQAGVNRQEAEKIFKLLESLDFYKYNNYTNPLSK